MGCDIHAYFEVKINDRWEHYGYADINRDYQLFSKMVPIIGRGDQKAIAPERGIPDDLNPLTGALFIDGNLEEELALHHTHSYLMGAELIILQLWLHNTYGDKYIGWIDSFFDTFEHIEHSGLRLVFKFDN